VLRMTGGGSCRKGGGAAVLRMPGCRIPSEFFAHSLSGMKTTMTTVSGNSLGT